MVKDYDGIREKFWSDMEDELRGTMGKALGKQGEKVLAALKNVEEQRVKYDQLISTCLKEDLDVNVVDKDATENGESKNESDSMSIIQKISFQSLPESKKTQMISILLSYNKYIQDAKQARWELTVHRQAVGFIVNNHKFVQDKFPIPPQLPTPFDLDESLLLSLNDGGGGSRSKCNDGNGNGIGADESKSIYYQKILNQLSGKKKDVVRNEPVVRNFGDQLDWWEKIGRWR